MKIKSKLMISSILLMMIFILSGCGYSVSFNNVNNLKKEDAIEFNVDKTVIEHIDKINISTSIAEIELMEDDDYYVEIKYSYWNKEPEYKVEDGVLSFNDDYVFPNSYSLNFNVRNYIKVYLPKDANLDQIMIDTSSGDVSIADFITERLDLEVAYGSLSINNASATKANIDLSSGNSEIKDFNFGVLEYNNSYGNATLTNINTDYEKVQKDLGSGELEISMSSGNCNIENITCESIDIENSYGNVTCKEMKVNEFDTNLSSGDLYVTKSTIKNADISDSYGNAKLFLSGNDKDYNLDLKTSYGKVEVNNKEYDGHLIRENNGSKSIVADLSSGDIDIRFE
ncbi:MAG: hypothetical protein K0S41_2769 [Anaerocolumna sp.]|jgi:DUF4097 and DUF4098 domain-containing protein YvlB|nr:hypothetical protein [Anaerocolumna sp.]